MSMFLCRASSRCCVRNSSVGFLWLWSYLYYPCVFERDFGPDCRFQTALRCWGKGCGGGGEGNILGSVSGAGMTRFQWAGTPSYAKITSSLISRLVLACARKLSKCAEFIPPTAAEENTSPLIGDIFMVTVKFITRWPPLRPLCLPRSTVTSGRPNVVAAFVDKHTVAYYGMVHKPGSVIDSLVQHIRSVSVSRKGPCQFHSKQHPV